jgi:hypothetical protein
MTEITEEMIDGYYNRWKNFLSTNNSEQHDFKLITMNDLMITAFYNDLKKNWNLDHAQKFRNAFEDTIIPRFSI